MQHLTKHLVLGLAALAVVSAPAQAQTIIQPEPAPQPTPIINPYPQPRVSYYGVPPMLPRPSAYSFNGPSSATVTYVYGTTSFYQPTPAGNRLVTAPYVMPVYGYTPGYYGGYYTPLF